MIDKQEAKRKTAMTDESVSNKLFQGIVEGLIAGNKMYTSLFFYGEEGLVSERCMGLAQAYQERYPSKKVVWESGQEFMLKMIRAIKEDSWKDYRRELYKGDILVFDHVEFIAGKRYTMQVFYELFDHYYMNGKPIVIGASMLPRLMDGLDDRIRTQFEGCLILHVE